MIAETFYTVKELSLNGEIHKGKDGAHPTISTAGQGNILFHQRIQEEEQSRLAYDSCIVHMCSGVLPMEHFKHLPAVALMVFLFQSNFTVDHVCMYIYIIYKYIYILCLCCCYERVGLTMSLFTLIVGVA